MLLFIFSIKERTNELCVTDLKLTNSRFCIVCVGDVCVVGCVWGDCVGVCWGACVGVRMNYFEVQTPKYL